MVGNLAEGIRGGREEEREREPTKGGKGIKNYRGTVDKITSIHSVQRTRGA